MGYQVKAPLVQALKADGGYVHVYEGGFLPDDQDPAQLEQLLEAGMVAEAEQPDGNPADEEAAPAKSPARAKAARKRT